LKNIFFTSNFSSLETCIQRMDVWNSIIVKRMMHSSFNFLTAFLNCYLVDIAIKALKVPCDDVNDAAKIYL